MFVRIAIVVTMLAGVASADAPSAYQCTPGTPKKGAGCTCPAGYADKRVDDNIAACIALPKPSEAALGKAECAKAQPTIVRAYGADLAGDELKRFRAQFSLAVTKRCETDPWSKNARKCFGNATTDELVFECLEMIAPVQRNGLDYDSARAHPITAEVVGHEVTLKSPIVFSRDIATMSDNARPQLAAIAKLMRDKPALRIEIQAHTDNVGNDNATLTEKRAQSLRAYLIAQGIAGDRLVAKGYGESQPVASNSSAWGRAKNRRIQLVVLAAAPVPKPAGRGDALHPPPAADRDGDRIPDAVDKCPDEPETYNGFEDDDGCPDRGRVVVTERTLETLDKVYFEFDKAAIKPESLPLLDQVAGALAGNPDILLVEVQGHSDERGDDAHNLDLTDKRAHAVAKYLVDKGVDAHRLTAQGYGETQPLDRGHNEAAWAKNRRVAFLILKRAAK